MIEGISGENIPQLYAKDGVELTDLILVKPEAKEVPNGDSDQEDSAD